MWSDLSEICTALYGINNLIDFEPKLTITKRKVATYEFEKLCFILAEKHSANVIEFL